MKEIIIPELGESVLGGTIGAWLVKEGDFINDGEPIMELETDKIAVQVPSTATGNVVEILVDEFEDVEVGQAVLRVDETAEQTDNKSADTSEQEEVVESEEVDSEKVETQQEEEASSVKEPVFVEKPTIAEHTPSQRKSQRISGVPNESKKEEIPSNEAKEKQETAQSIDAPNYEPSQEDKPVEIQRFTRRRQTIAKNLVEAQQTMAMLTTFNEVDMSAIMNFRRDVQDRFVKQYDVKLGFLSFFIKACIAGFQKYPALNSELRGQELHLKKYYDLGIAISTDEGLVVPVVHDCERKSFAQIEQDIVHLADKARQGKLELNDLQGGTFTITNGGIFGSTNSTPIINMPQAAILGMHGIKNRVVVDKHTGEHVTRPIMELALTYDHRIVDGREAASFLSEVVRYIENPINMLID